MINFIFGMAVGTVLMGTAHQRHSKRVTKSLTSMFGRVIIKARTPGVDNEEFVKFMNDEVSLFEMEVRNRL